MADLTRLLISHGAINAVDSSISRRRVYTKWSNRPVTHRKKLFSPRNRTHANTKILRMKSRHTATATMPTALVWLSLKDMTV